MINEAFWFFYLVGLIDKLDNLLLISIITGTLSGLFVVLYFAIEREDCYGGKDGEKLKAQIATAQRIAKIWVIAVLSIALITFFVPTKESLYAGAGQYVTEATELDQTMLQLKDILDEKIEELEK